MTKLTDRNHAVLYRLRFTRRSAPEMVAWAPMTVSELAGDGLTRDQARSAVKALVGAGLVEAMGQASGGGRTYRITTKGADALDTKAEDR